MPGTYDWVELLRRGKSVYTFGELLRLSGLSPPSLRRALHRLRRRGLVLKLGRGFYANGLSSPSLEEVAGFLYPPSYISSEYALFLHGVLDQAPYEVTCVTLNKTKVFRTDLGEISYFHIKPELFFGYEVQDGLILAEPEKALLDFVYLARKRGLEPTLDELNWEHVRVDRLRFLLRFYPKAVRSNIERFGQVF